MTSVSLPRLGLRENAGQFALLVAVNGLVGGMIGQERTVLPQLARDVFGLTAFTVVLSFVLAFGVTKALANLAARVLADRYGRKPVLVAGWMFGLPVPLLLNCETSGSRVHRTSWVDSRPGGRRDCPSRLPQIDPRADGCASVACFALPRLASFPQQEERDDQGCDRIGPPQAQGGVEAHTQEDRE